MILGKKSALFSQIGKVYLSNLDFSAYWECFSWECFRLIGIFLASWGKIWFWKPDPVLYREKVLPLSVKSQ